MSHLGAAKSSYFLGSEVVSPLPSIMVLPFFCVWSELYSLLIFLVTRLIYWNNQHVENLLHGRCPDGPLTGGMSTGGG